MTSKIYKKRPGTTGIRGQLYETKLISLIHFRAKHNVNIKSFALATNVDNIGIFDDVCLRFKAKTFNKPIAVFVQAKHRENDILLKNDFHTYFDSYLKIKQAFNSSNKDLIFKGQFDEVECFFVIFTTARGDYKYKPFENSCAGILDDIICTAQCSQQMVVKNKDVECLYNIIMKEQMTKLAKLIAKLFFNEITDLQTLMNDELVASYHAILGQKFCNISDIQPEGYRLARIKQEFLDTNDEYLMIFKSSLYNEIIEKRTVDESELKTLMTVFFDRPSDVTILSKLIGCAMTYKNGNLEFVNIKMINEDLQRRLSTVHVPDGILNKAIEIAGREIMSSKQNLFKVPVSFGNKDLIITKDSRLTYLKSKIIELIGKANHNNVITLDDTVDKGLLKLNGGLTGAVGNLLVFDENSKMLMFNDSIEELGDNAKRLLTKLKQNENLHLSKYRIDVKIKTFPKLTFECGDHDKNIAKDFFNRLIFYTSQANENCTGKILREEIEKHKSNQVSKNSFLSHLIFLKYHDAIQNWWMSPILSDYLTEKSDIFENAMKTVVSEPPMTVMNRMYEIKTKEADITFNDKVMDSLELNVQPGYIVITESIALTLYKLKQYLQNKEHDIIDLEYSLKLLPSEYEALLNELQNTSKDKIIIIVVDIILDADNDSNEKIEKFAKIIKNELTIIITRTKLQQMVQEIFSKPLNIVNDDKTNLTDLCDYSQYYILQKKIVFQGQEIKLITIIDDISKTFVKGDVLCKIIHNETVTIGKTALNLRYRTIQSMYIGRRVCRNKKRDVPIMRIQAEDDTLIRLKRLHYEACTRRNEEKKAETCNNEPNEQQQESIHIDTLHDLDDDVIVLMTEPGAGKSTLFDHLIRQTNKIDQTTWIVRTNLSDYSRQFNSWQTNRTQIDILECLKFMYLVIFGEHKEVTFALQEINNEIHAEFCTGDQWSIFELKIFLHFYNRKKLIFLFDGFDEICPDYTNEALALIRSLKNYSIIKNKIWITSRPHTNIKKILEEEFEVSYDLENFSWVERNMFLFLFWITNEILNNLVFLHKHIYDFIDFTSQCPTVDLFFKKNEPSELNEKPIMLVYINFICYLKVELKSISISPRINNALNTLYDKCIDFLTFQNDFVTNPLNLRLLAEYFLHEIIYRRIAPNKWLLETDDFKFYKHFIDTKIRTVFYQEKYKLYFCSLDVSRVYKQIRKRLDKKYELLGAYAVFNAYKDNIFSKKELKQINEEIDLLKNGPDKTGIICSIVNDIPIFVHTTLGDIFAVEYISAVIKREHLYSKNKSMCEFIIINVEPRLKIILECKLKEDTELKAIIDENKKYVQEFLIEQCSQPIRSYKFLEIFFSLGITFVLIYFFGYVFVFTLAVLVALLFLIWFCS